MIQHTAQELPAYFARPAYHSFYWFSVGQWTCSGADVSVRAEMGLFNSKTRLEEEDFGEFTYKQLPPFPAPQHVARQETATSENFSRTTTIITVGAAFVAANLLLAIALKPDRPKLQNHHMCGIPSGGKVLKRYLKGLWQ